MSEFYLNHLHCPWGFIFFVLELTLTSGIDWTSGSMRAEWALVWWGTGPLSTDTAGCLHHVATRWQCSSALKNPSLSVVCVLVQHQDHWLNEMYCTVSGQTCCQYLDDTGSFHESISFLLGEVMLCWGQSSTGTTGIGLFTTRGSPFPQAQNRHRGPVELWDECLCQRYDSVLNLVWMWSEPHRKKPFIPRSFLLSPGPICYPRFVADVVLCP